MSQWHSWRPGAECWAAGDEVLLRCGSVLIGPIKLMLCVKWLGVSVCVWGIPGPVAVGVWLLHCCIPQWEVGGIPFVPPALMK